MPKTKQEIVSTLEKARAQLDVALSELEKLPAVSHTSVCLAAHALNNFLTVTGGTVELLQLSLGKNPDPQLLAGLKNLEQANNLMEHIVSQLINSSTDENPALQFEEVDLSVMVERFCRFYQRIADRKQIRVLQSAVGIPTAWTDRVATAAVLDNLLSNAVKYLPPGKRVWVELSAETNGVVCSVRDEGPGISAEDQTRLFQPAAQLSARPTAGESSSGYGLAVAKKFIERLGGTIWYDSVPGQGACFSFRLPRRQVRRKSATSTARSKSVAPSG